MADVMRWRGHRLPTALIVFVLLAGLLAVFPATVGATAFVVTECGDGADPNTLRGRIAAANADNTATPAAPHVITFAFGSACPLITLASGQLTLSEDMTIQGPGAAALTVSGNDASRVFLVNAGVTATISGLTITGGNSGDLNGGGIHNNGTLTVTDSAIFDNTNDGAGGGIFNFGGTVTVTDSAITDNSAATGGGIFSTGGALTVTDSTISGNTVEFTGGGIFSHVGTLDVISSTISGNSAGTEGGGINNNSASTATITSSTISGNSAQSGGGIMNFSTLDIIASTVADNTTVSGAGLHNHGDTAFVTLSGTLLASNTPSNCLNTQSGTLTSLGYNLSDDDSCALSATGDLDNNPNANLSPLANFGGPTETHALQSNSSAINVIPPDGSAGCGTTILTDQRGEPRPFVGTNCDIGAYESDIIFVQTYFQACLYAGSLSKVSSTGTSDVPTVNCGRGTPVVLLAGDDPAASVYYACLYAGALSEVGLNEPANCGRGEPISLVQGTTLHACLYAGQLSQVGFNPPSNCGRGAPIALVGHAIKIVR